MFAEIEAGLLETRGRLQHSVACLLCSARFRNDYRQRVREVIADLVEDTIETVGIGVIEKINVKGIVRVAESVRDELRPERRAADSDQQDVFEGCPALGSDLPAVNVGRELLNARVSLVDVRAELRRRREAGIAEPIMPDHSLLVRVCDRARFQFAHVGEGLLDPRPHLLEEIVRETHPADVDRKIQVAIAQEIFLESRPK